MTKQVQNRTFAMAKESFTLTSIAKIIGVSVNTVSRILYDNIKTHLCIKKDNLHEVAFHTKTRKTHKGL